jgi:hypothetical protein
MAKEVLELTVKSNIGEVTKETDDLGKSIGKASDETKDLDKGLEDAGKSGKKGFEAIGTAVKGFGVALKAAGIGLVIALFTTLKEALERNQTVMNGVSTIMTTVSTTFNQVVDTLIDVVSWVTASQDRFDGLTKVVTSLITIALTPLKLSFYAIKGAVLGAMLAWEDSFLGGGDEDKMAALRSELKTTGDDIKQIGLDAIAAGKEVVENVGDAITEIGAIGEMVIDQISQISVKANYEMAAATTAAANSSKLAEAQIQGLIEKNDLLAETQRQIRDDETKTFAERIEANKKIGEILDNQEKEMMKLADTRVNAAALELAANKDNIDLQVAYQATLNDRAAVEAQIAGFRSEQLTNEVSLNKELAETQKEIAQDSIDGINRELLELENAYKLKLEMARKAGVETVELTKQYEKEKQAILDAAAEEEIATEKAVLEAKKAIRDANVRNIEAGIGLVKDLAGENKAILAAAVVAENAAGIAKTITNTVAANAKAVGASPLTAGQPWVAINSISAGIGIASSIAATAKALSQLGGGGSAGSVPSLSGGGAAATTPAPQMMSGAFELGGGVKPEPMKAFVVTDEMSNSQSQLANIRRRATI